MTSQTHSEQPPSCSLCPCSSPNAARSDLTQSKPRYLNQEGLHSRRDATDAPAACTQGTRNTYSHPCRSQACSSPSRTGSLRSWRRPSGSVSWSRSRSRWTARAHALHDQAAFSHKIHRNNKQASRPALHLARDMSRRCLKHNCSARTSCGRCRTLPGTSRSPCATPARRPSGSPLASPRISSSSGRPPDTVSIYDSCAREKPLRTNEGGT